MTVRKTNEFAGEFISEVIISAECDEDASRSFVKTLFVLFGFHRF